MNLEGETYALKVLKSLKYAELRNQLIKKYGSLKYCPEHELKKLEKLGGEG